MDNHAGALSHSLKVILPSHCTPCVPMFPRGVSLLPASYWPGACGKDLVTWLLEGFLPVTDEGGFRGIESSGRIRMSFDARVIV